MAERSGMWREKTSGTRILESYAKARILHFMLNTMGIYYRDFRREAHDLIYSFESHSHCLEKDLEEG